MEELVYRANKIGEPCRKVGHSCTRELDKEGNVVRAKGFHINSKVRCQIESVGKIEGVEGTFAKGKCVAKSEYDPFLASEPFGKQSALDWGKFVGEKKLMDEIARMLGEVHMYLKDLQETDNGTLYEEQKAHVESIEDMGKEITDICRRIKEKGDSRDAEEPPDGGAAAPDSHTDNCE